MKDNGGYLCGGRRCGNKQADNPEFGTLSIKNKLVIYRNLNVSKSRKLVAYYFLKSLRKRLN